jgi:hypothetical protein
VTPFILINMAEEMDIYERHRILRAEAEASMRKVVKINRQLRAAEGNGHLPPLPPLPPYPPPPGQAPAIEDAAAAAHQHQQANPLANPLMAGIQAMRQQTPILHRMAPASGIKTRTPGRLVPH